MADSKKSDAPSSTIPLRHPTSPSWKPTFRRSLRTVLTIFSYTPLAFLLSRLAYLISPSLDSNSRSPSNNLHFRFADPASPLATLGRYPVGITAGVMPKRFHAHNDYQHPFPLFTALSHGAASIEADIWLVDGELLVGHDIEDLNPKRTLRALYLDPLKEILDHANPQSSGDTMAGKLKGVWELAPDMPLHLLIDIKTDGASTFEALYAALAPLRKARYLTTWTSEPFKPQASGSSSGSLFDLSSKQPRAWSSVPQDGGTLRPSALTIIGTGNTLLTSVAVLGSTSNAPRDVFYDAVLDVDLDIPPTSVLHNLEDEANGKSKPAVPITSSLSPLASADLRHAVGPIAWLIPSLARSRVRALVQAAHARGIQTRFWRLPVSSTDVFGMMRMTGLRNSVWRMLVEEGVDWLNVDDLGAVAVW